MATPHVAGLAALLMEHKPEATADEVEEAIFRSCTRPAGASTVRVNRGVPDASKALEELDNGA
jgi:subtilisin